MAQKLNLLLMGKSGGGKSFTGNNILGRPSAFKVSASSSSVTKRVLADFGRFENYTLKIVDGPGLKDTDVDSGADQEIAAANMAQALAMCDGGVDAFLFVCKYGGRFTAEEKAALDGLKNIFGEKYYSHMIVVLTMGELFRNDMEDEGKGNINFLDWCMQQTGSFRQLFDDCEGRCVLFNNREKNENTMKKQRKEIIDLANKLQTTNGRYTNQNFQAAKELRERYIVEKKVPILSEQIQQKCGLLTADLENYMKAPTEQDKFKIQESIEAVKKEIEEQDKGTNLLQPVRELVERVKESLDDIEKLKELTQKLNDTRKLTIGLTAFGWLCASGSGVASAVAGASIATTVIAFTAPPVAVGIGIGATIFSAAATCINYVRATSQQKELQEEHDKTKSKLEKALTGRKSTK